jgi:iron complex outermembrane receptor protein
MFGLSKKWGYSKLAFTAYHLTPGIIEGERDTETGELLRDEGFSGHSYGKSLPSSR